MKKYFKFIALGVMLSIFSSCEDSDDPTINPDSISLDVVADSLSSPVLLVESPDNSKRLFIVDQVGVIYIITDGQLQAQPFLDIRNKIVDLESGYDERGLLGLAFHPDFESNGRFYVYYSAPLRAGGPSGWDHTSHISEFTVSPANAAQADPATEQVILSVDQPQANHNAGTVSFGSDNYLYISLGDGGGGDDVALGHVDDWYPQNDGGNGQDINQNLLGSILRIDVDQGDTYGIPPDNPFVDQPGLDAIYAYGFRNPYRFCFDPDGKLIVADAGQELYEEVNLVEMGGNYGWNVKEGTHCFNAENPEVPRDSCPSIDSLGNELIDPVIEIKNSNSFSDGLGIVVVGGYVYEGDLVSALNGKYIFGVYAQTSGAPDGALFAANRSGDTWDFDKLIIENMDNNELGMYVMGFGQDNEGDVYVMAKGEAENTGTVYKINNQLL